MIDDAMVTKVATVVDHLAESREASDWLLAFVQRKASSGYRDAMGAPVEYLVRSSANHSSRTETVANWVVAHLQVAVERVPHLGSELTDEFLLEALFGWCERREDPDHFSEFLLQIFQAGDESSRTEWSEDLVRAFKGALARNQVDASLKGLWLDLLNGDASEHGFIRNWDIDFHGLLHMQAGQETFDWEAIGHALKTVFETLLPETRSILRSSRGPISGLYEDLGAAADLDESELSEKLWCMARSNGWSTAQQHTIPLHFFELSDGKGWSVPQVAMDWMLAWKKIPCQDSHNIVVVVMNSEDRSWLADVEIQTIEDYERERRNSCKPHSPDIVFNNQMLKYFDRERIAEVVRQRNALGKNVEQIKKRFGSALYRRMPQSQFEEEIEKHAVGC